MNKLLRKIFLFFLCLNAFNNVYATNKVALAYQFFDWAFEAREFFNSNVLHYESQHLNSFLEHPSSLRAEEKGNIIIKSVLSKGASYGGANYVKYLLPALISDDESLNDFAISIIESFIEKDEGPLKYHSVGYQGQGDECMHNPDDCGNRDFERDPMKRYQDRRKNYVITNVLNNFNLLNESSSKRLLKIFIASQIDITDASEFLNCMKNQIGSKRAAFFERYLVATKGDGFKLKNFENNRHKGSLNDAICFLDSFEILKKNRFTSSAKIDCKSFFKNNVQHAFKESFKIFLKNAKNTEVIRVSKKVLRNLRYKHNFEYQYLIFFIAFQSNDSELRNLSMKVLKGLIDGADHVFKRERVKNYNDILTLGNRGKKDCSDEFVKKIYDCSTFGFLIKDKNVTLPDYYLDSVSKRYNYFLLQFLKFEKDLDSSFDVSGMSLQVLQSIDLEYKIISKTIEEYLFFFHSKALMKASRGIIEKYMGDSYLDSKIKEKEVVLLEIYRDWLLILNNSNVAQIRPLMSFVSAIIIKRGLSEGLLKIFFDKSDELLAVRNPNLKDLINLSIVFSKSNSLKTIMSQRMSSHAKSDLEFKVVFDELIRSIKTFRSELAENDMSLYLSYLELFKDKKSLFFQKIKTKLMDENDKNYGPINVLADIYIETEYPELKRELLSKNEHLSGHPVLQSIEEVEKALQTLALGSILSVQEVNNLKNQLSNKIFANSYSETVQEKIKELVNIYGDVLSDEMFIMLNLVGYYGAKNIEKGCYIESIKRRYVNEAGKKKFLVEIFSLFSEKRKKVNVYLYFIKELDIEDEFVKFEFFRFIKRNRDRHNIEKLFVGNAKLLFSNTDWSVIPEIDDGYTPSILINSGSKNEPNYTIFEIELNVFDKYLFYDGSIILNAGGKGQIQTVEVKKHNADRRLNIVSKSKINKDFKQSSLVNLTDSVEQIAKKRPTDVTLLFTGHGGKNGIKLWSEEILNPLILRELYKGFGDEVTIRSIFLGCYSGSMIVDEKRVVPKSLQRFKKFIKYSYQKNQCSLAKALHDEDTSSIVDNNGDKWRNLFQQYPEISLQKIRAFLEDEIDSYSSPVLSSDYLIFDFEKYICKSSNTYFSFCLDQKKQYSIRLKEINLQSSMFKDQMKLWTKKFQMINDEKILNLESEIDTILDFYPKDYTILDISERDLQEIEKLNEKIGESSKKSILIPYEPDNLEYFNSKIREFFSDNTNLELFSALKEVVLDKKSLYEQIDGFYYMEKIKAAKSRKNELKRERLNRDKILNILKMPIYKEIYKVFQNLLACEAAPVSM